MLNATLTVLALPGILAQASPDTILAKALALELPTLPTPIVVHHSPGFEARATALQRGARTVRRLLVDSLDVEPAEIALLVLDESDWAEVTAMPYGLHSMLGEAPVFLAPARLDRGIYYDSAAADAEFGVDLIGLHYLAHFFAAEALYQEGHAQDPPVKWLDEIFTLMLAAELYEAIDPGLREVERRSVAESLELTAPRVTELADFDAEYRRYFVTLEGGANYAWFLAHLAGWGRQIRESHGLGVVRRVRDALAATPGDIDTQSALRLLEGVGVQTAGWQ